MMNYSYVTIIGNIFTSILVFCIVFLIFEGRVASFAFVNFLNSRE